MKYSIYIKVGELEAASKAEATREALALLDELASSNDGSEVLANAKPIVGTWDV